MNISHANLIRAMLPVFWRPQAAVRGSIWGYGTTPDHKLTDQSMGNTIDQPRPGLLESRLEWQAKHIPAGIDMVGVHISGFAPGDLKILGKA